MRRKWYLIQVEMESTAEVNPEYTSNNEFWCIFVARHMDDTRKSHELSRWWPE